MATSYKMQGNTLWVQLEGELDHHPAQQVKKKCQMMMVSNPVENIGFDFLKTDFMDSSGIGVIMGRYKTICLIGGEVWAVHANARIKKILTLSGVTKIMQIYEEDEA